MATVSGGKLKKDMKNEIKYQTFNTAGIHQIPSGQWRFEATELESLILVVKDIPSNRGTAKLFGFVEVKTPLNPCGCSSKVGYDTEDVDGETITTCHGCGERIEL